MLSFFFSSYTQVLFFEAFTLVYSPSKPLCFSVFQMPLNMTNAVITARQLLVYTFEAANFSDKMDVIFVAEMIEKFGKFAEKYKEVSPASVPQSHLVPPLWMNKMFI